MRSIIYLYFALFASSKLIAGDIPCGATLLSTDDPMFVTFDNAFNSNSGIAPPPYGGYIGPDTWISFIMPSGGFYLILEGNTMIDPAIAIYEGPCANPKLLYNVLDNNCDGDPNPLLFIDQLTPGQQYYIRVWAQDGSPNGILDIKMLQTISGIPDFIAFADATIVGDCIELTQDVNTQQGCAWFQNAIDFTMPFNHEMTANFGTLDANGADGICLVYQSNGQDFCGGTGEGIGAGGMPNSAIFEFDTWQNGNLTDPVQDHCAFNVNGNMNHNSSIEGPVTLGNIEDGLDHTIVFDWNPAGNLYAVYFDGALVLSGSYDIINNCFGGSSTAFWGYTSATGGSTNLHVICPVVEVFEPSFIEYNEVDICEGESYLGHTESGFYVDFTPGSNGCQYQFNTLINVHEIPEPHYVYEVVCEGEFVQVANDVFTLPDLYEINTYNEFGCDSVIFLQLDNVITSLEIEPPLLITCNNSTVQLIPNPSSNYDITSVNYTWSGNQITTNQDTLQVNESGTYFLTALITSNGMTCLSFTNVTVEIDTVSPILQNVSDLYIDCTNLGTDTLLYVSGLGLNIEPTWIFEDSIISLQDSVSIMGEGMYTIIATDTINGCQTTDSLWVTMSNDIPIIELDAEELNCQRTTIEPYFTSTGIIDTFLWTFNDQFFSDDSIPSFNQAGNYNIKVISKDGCESTASIQIKIDTLAPVIDLQNYTIPCDILSTDLTPIIDQNMIVEWNGPNINAETNHNITITEDGWYHLSVTNPDNFCTSSDSSFVEFKGSSPTLSAMDDTLNCYTPSATIDLIPNQSDLTFEWTHNSNLFSNSEDILVIEEGWYFINVVNQNDCFATDSVYVTSNFTIPTIDIAFDTINCITTAASINAAIINGDIISWTGPDTFQSTENSFTTSSSGSYILSVINETSGCESVDTIEIINTSVIPEFEIVDDTLTCNTTYLELPFSISTSYLSLKWSGPNGFSSDLLNPGISQEGEYFIHLEFEGECTLDTSLFIHQNITPPEYSLSYDSITCSNPNVTINTNIEDDNSQFSLTTPTGEITNMTEYVSSDAGVYIFYIESTNGCSSTETIYIESYLEEPYIAISDFGYITCTDPEINILTSTSDENLIYNWNGPNGFSSNDNNLTLSQGGNYSLQVTNEYGCISDEEIFVASFLDVPEIDLQGSDIYCDQLQSIIVYHSPNDNFETTWSGENSFVNRIDSIIVEDAGWYSILAENEYGCTNTDSIFIQEYLETPEIILVTGDTIVVDVNEPKGQIQIEVNSNSDFDVNWFPQEGLSCNTCFDPIINSIGTIFYEVVITNEYGCETSKFIQVRYREELRIDIPNIFSPGKEDGINDSFTLYGNEKVAMVNHMLVYDRWGQLVASNENFEPNIPALGWDGLISGKLGIPGVYVYVFQIITTDGEILNYYGDVTLI